LMCPKFVYGLSFRNSGLMLLQLPCGLNGALYFSQMDADGGVAKSNGNNKAGPKYGTGYCDAQCPRDIKFINGVANSAGWAASPNDSRSSFLSGLIELM
jgi:cellulose 1,4-beta-cellobiosidase